MAPQAPDTDRIPLESERNKGVTSGAAAQSGRFSSSAAANDRSDPFLLMYGFSHWVNH